MGGTEAQRQQGSAGARRRRTRRFEATQICWPRCMAWTICAKTVLQWDREVSCASSGSLIRQPECLYHWEAGCATMGGFAAIFPHIPKCRTAIRFSAYKYQQPILSKSDNMIPNLSLFMDGGAARQIIHPGLAHPLLAALPRSRGSFLVGCIAPCWRQDR
ncbi:hypothetical protein BD289DRAFT_104689 [Coniella lustricola]|uniref:Uncharacterized protein n=1 Tax=Coniella lustricola TaxID=2025994 RepID=A0A2T2ZXS9_9PEZI|nr:hypothetical protein BD289DRAFT_104689 [Coniella lustricola]